MPDSEDEPVSVLYVGPDDAVAAEHTAILERAGFSVERCSEPPNCLDRLAGRVGCIVGTDRLDGVDAVTLLQDVRRKYPDLPYVLVATDGDETVASEAIRAGVTDYVPDDDGEPPDLAERVTEAVDALAGRRQFRGVDANADDAFYAVDEEFRFTYVDDRTEELLQADAEELLGERVWEVLPAAAETPARDAFHEAMETQEPTSYEVYHESLASWIDARIYPSEPGLSVYVRDVTERKGRERELERYEVLAEESTDVNAILDQDGRFQYLTPSVERVLGHDPDELVGDRAFEYVHPEDRAEVESMFYAMTDDGDTRPTHEFRFARADGSWATIEATGRNLLEDPTIDGIVVYTRDVTERTEREQALHDAYETIADADRSFHEQVTALFEVVQETVGTDYATLARVRDGEYVFEVISAPADVDIEAGDVVPLKSLPNCKHVVETEETLSLGNVEAEAPELVDPEFGISSYLGAPITVGGETYGTFCFYDTEVQAEEFSDWMVTFVDLLGNWVEYELERQRTTDRLAAINDLNAVVRDINRALAGQSTREEIEQVVCERLAASDSYCAAWIGTVEGRTGEVVPTTTADVEGYLEDVTITVDDSETGQGPAGTALRTGEFQVAQNIEQTPECEPWRDQARKRGYRSSAAIPLVYENRSYGVLNVYSAREDAFDEEEQAVVGQLGEVVGLALAVVEQEREIRERERRYRTLAENIPSGSVTLFDTDLRYRTVAGTIYDEFDLDPEEMEGSHVRDVDGISPEVGEKLERAYRAALDGEPQTVQVESQGATLDVQVIPIRDETGEITCGMTLSQDITEREEREQQLQHERERLEFVNRLIRHNLLNSLNVVQGRTGLLEPHVDREAEQHLEMVHKRTEEMITLIETLRTLMQAIIDKEDHELEPVDLGAVLRDEVEQARRTFDHAEFDVEADLRETGFVVADGLLNEVFENLLENAVEHNDKDVPRVNVDVTGDEETVTVTIADNGPGIPGEMEDRLFEKGERGFRSLGTGFGLYLVREIVDIYDGTISVESNDSSGVAVSVALPRASDSRERADGARDARGSRTLSNR